MKIRYVAACHRGIMREANEDAVLVDDHIIRDEEIQGEVELRQPFLAVIADGMGGHDFGEIASMRALETFHAEMDKVNWKRKHVNRQIEAAVLLAHLGLLELCPTHGNLGTTLCGVLFSPRRKIYMVNVGDSRLYRLRGGRLRQLSVDHTWRQEMHNPNIPGNWLTSVLGGGSEDIKIDVRNLTHQIRVGDILLLCSDGLSEYNSADQIAEIVMRDPKSAHSELVRLALANGGQDNISAMVIQILK